MATTMDSVAHDQSNSSFIRSHEVVDYAAKARDLDLRQKALQDQLDAILKEQNDNRAAREEFERKAKFEEENKIKRQMMKKQQENRQAEFQLMVDGSVLVAVREKMNDDEDLKNAVHLLAKGVGFVDTKYHMLLNRYLVDETLGLDEQWVESIANKIVKDVTKSESENNSIKTSDLSNGDTSHITDLDQISSKQLDDATIEATSSDEVNETAVKPIESNTTECSAQNNGQAGSTNLASQGEDRIIDPEANQQAVEPVTTKSTVEKVGVQDTSEAVLTPKIKREQEDEVVTPPSAKRRKLAEIENSAEPEQDNEIMQSLISINIPSLPKSSTPARNTPSRIMAPPQTPGLVDTIEAVSVLSRNSPESVARSDTSSKHGRKSSSILSSAATSTQTPFKKPATTPKKTLTGPEKRFTKRLDALVKNGESVSHELECQQCHRSNGVELRFSACSHLYCQNCLAKIRKAAQKDDTTAVCTVCENDVGKKSTAVHLDKLDEWKKIYASDEDGDATKEDDENEDDADEEEDGEGEE